MVYTFSNAESKKLRVKHPFKINYQKENVSNIAELAAILFFLSKGGHMMIRMLGFP